MSLSAATVNDRERVADALRFYLERVNWASHDEERGEYKRLLAEYDDAPPVLPPARELHEAARASRSRTDEPTVPPVFPWARERARITEAAASEATAQIHQLVIDAHTLGVPMSVLARWTGYAPRWVQKIVGKP